MFHKRTIKASQDNGQRYKWGGQGPCQGSNISLTHVHCCANLYKTVSRTLSIIWSISCYLAMLPKCPNWNLRVHHDRNTCVNALRSLSGSKPFLMIEWGTPWNTPGRARITIFGRQTADYSHSAIISRACLRSIERCY